MGVEPATSTALRSTSSRQARYRSGNNFDFIRVVMAMAVIFSHAYPLSQPGADDPIYRLTLGQVTAGEIAVDVFFVISGYLIAASRARSSAGPFLARRVLRIYPGFLVAMAVSGLVVGPLAVENPPAYWNWPLMCDWMINTVTLDSWVVSGTFDSNAYPMAVNGSLWTVRWEFVCYLLMLCVGSRAWARPAVVTLAIVAVVANAASCVGVLSVREIPVGPVVVPLWRVLVFASLFFVGALAWRFREVVSYSVWIVIGCVAILSFAARLPTARAFDLIAPLALSYIALACALAKLPIVSDFARRVGGDYSYGIYLYAFPIQQLVTMSFGGRMNPWVNFAIATPLAIVAGFFSWHLVEKHFIARRREHQRSIETVSTPTDVAISE